MSKELPKPNKPEEVDLIFIFSVFEKIFKKIGAFISKAIDFFKYFIKKGFILALFAINLVRKNALILIILSIVSFGGFYFFIKPKGITYSSDMLLKQNFKTGKVLYRNISTFNALAAQKDSIALAKELNIPVTIAAKINGFSIAHNANKNVLMTDYFEFQKLTDSTTKISYDDFITYNDLENFPLQAITVFTEDPSVYQGLSEAVLKSILKNDYLLDLKNKETEAINRRKELYKQLVLESDTLQTSYFKLLKDYYGLNEVNNPKPNSSTINLNLDNKKDKINTREYDLYKDAKTLKLEINQIENELKEKEEIFVVQKGFTSPFIVKYEYLNRVIYFTFLIILLVLFILLIKELDLIKTLDKYGTKEKLFEKNVKK